MNKKSSDIVIGIDFGTTYSGVSWAYPGRRDVRLITNWPNPKTKNASNDKVPSTISYCNGQVERWGYSNRDKDETFRWFKILLEPSHKYNDEVKEVKDASKLLKSLNKSPEEVVADYLKVLWDYTMEDIKQEVKEDNWKRDYALKVVITVPAMWSDAAKDKTKKAALMAGLPDNITMITEPEAAALSIIRDKADEESLGAGDTFVVCDAGGGTVDLISYTINNLRPLEIQETVKGEGGLCGSVYLNISFQNYIEILIGKEQYDKLPVASKRNMMMEFDQTIKRIFNEKNNEVHTIDLFGVEDDPNNDIDDNTIVLKKSALQGIFDHVFLQIEALIENQVTQIKKQNKCVEAILLVGGFGESRYLHDRVTNCHKSDGTQILRVQGAWSSICRGATLAGLEGIGGALGRPPKVVSRIARYSYGFAVSTLFDPSEHLPEDRYLCESEGVYRANNQMMWILEIGDNMEEGRKLTRGIYHSVQVGFWDSGDRKFSTKLYCCEEANPPSRKTMNVHELCNVNYSVPCTKLWQEQSYRNPITGRKSRNCNFELFINLGKGSLDFAVLYRDEILAAAEVEYKEDF
ncbi:hypothetical protein HYFRA_00014199 [Hymenoscyphus fraxineus]|uniref:Actin-like ATPase domain-containing protein n=1 Tax=Hymenoscyphus fraxineus TaxID=746836 RepID=A0A9N9LB99_9HELO|nr:hypothetical protein HYFRA_00014199 [Hymenoscyphus fraxineus]